MFPEQTELYLKLMGHNYVYVYLCKYIKYAFEQANRCEGKYVYACVWT